ncbi:unnamed protein product [Sphagnum balticum]
MTRFDEFLSVILWFQTAYAVWQFRGVRFLQRPSRHLLQGQRKAVKVLWQRWQWQSIEAKNFNTASIFVSLGIIIMDLTSVWCNMIPLESDTEELFQPVSKEGNMVYDTVRRFRINGKDHFVETTMEEETAEGGLYTIKVKDCEGSEVERMTAPLTAVHKMWRFFEILAETGTWPVTEIRGKSIHVVSPCDSIVDGTYDYAVKCTLYEEEEMFVS